MPSISQISSLSVVPRRSASASTRINVSGRAPAPEPEEPANMSTKASTRCASKDVPSLDPAAFHRFLAAASTMGATRAHSTSSQRNSPSDTAVLRLVPPEMTTGVDPGTTSPLGFAPAGGGSQIRGRVAELLVARPTLGQRQQGCRGVFYLRGRLGHQLELVGR
jgi:hypothetical protein